MNVTRLTIVLLLGYAVVIESFKISRVQRSAIGGETQTARYDDFTTISDNRNKSSNSSDDDSPDLEIVNCSDLNSTLGRALKWVFVATSKRDHAPTVKFYVSSRNQPARVEVQVGDEFRLEPTDFKVERRTVFIVHGFKSGGFKNWVKRMEEALLLWGDVNVVVVDWSLGKKSINYYDAAINTKIVGNEIAKFLSQVVNATTVATSPNTPHWGTLHLIGHSLGAHICGVAARNFQEMQNVLQVNRITGLDPAQLCFTGVSSEFRLDRTDALFVDVIHTSAQSKSNMGFGMLEPIGAAIKHIRSLHCDCSVTEFFSFLIGASSSVGHVDIYPNGGISQPGCSRRTGSVLSYLKVPKTPMEQAKCSHKRSEYYLIESLVAAATGNCTFWAHPWDRSESDVSRVTSESCNSNNCTEMGIRAENYSLRGTFYLTTSAKPPFCVPYEYNR